jgi:hypothetical protein
MIPAMGKADGKVPLTGATKYAIRGAARLIAGGALAM